LAWQGKTGSTGSWPGTLTDFAKHKRYHQGRFMTLSKTIALACLAMYTISSGSFVDAQTAPQGGQSGASELASQVKSDDSPYKMSARFHLQQGSNEGYLVLQIDLPKGSYVYSLTQKGDLEPSKIRVVPSNSYSTKGRFNPDRPPIVVEEDPVFNQRVEKHKDSVQFFVPLKVRDDVDLKKMSPELVFTGQVCSENGVCMPLRNKKLKAKFAGYFDRTSQKRASTQNSDRK
jgi:thiol:disulfide interchange protein